LFAFENNCPNFKIDFIEKLKQENEYVFDYNADELDEIMNDGLDKNSKRMHIDDVCIIDQAGEIEKKNVLKEAAGIWKNRDDLPDFSVIRSEWDR